MTGPDVRGQKTRDYRRQSHGTRAKRIAYLTQQIAKQRRWIEEHGDTQAGYVLRYGEGVQAIGDGGGAIYRADMADLDRLQAELRELQS